MTAQDYRTAGYSVALQTEQSVIDRAEADVCAAYIVPLLGTDYDAEDAAVRDCVMCLSYLLMQERTIQATRAGGKVKNVTQSYSPTFSELLQQHAATCAFQIEKIAQAAGVAQWWKKVSDICCICFKSNYFSINL